MATNSIARFRTLIAHTPQASDPEVRLALNRLAAECKEKLGDSSPRTISFFDGLCQSLHQLKGRANAEMRIGCLYDCARYFYTVGNTPKAIHAAREGLTLARTTRNDALARKGLTFLGTSLADAGAIGEAIECHVAAIELAQRLHDQDGHGISLHNLGLALIYASQYEDAIRCFDQSQTLVQDPEFAKKVHAGALANKALCFLRLDQIREGLECVRQSIREAGEPISGDEILSRINRECTQVQLLLEAGDIDAATRSLHVIRDLLQKNDSQKTRVAAAIAEGLLEIYRGDSSRGIELLHGARDASGDVDSLLQDSLVALVKGYDQLHQSKKALDCLRQLMHRFALARRELAVKQIRSEMRGSSADLRALREREALLRAKVAEEELGSSQIEMLERFAVTADLREEATGEHGYRVGRLSALLAEDAGLDADTCLAIDLAARLHDIGKTGIPDRILLTSQELKDAERHFMCQHTVIGAELLAKSNISQLRLAEEIALYHHEWWDGSGYPKKLAGKRIPLHARMVALADVFDALTHGRPYSDPWSMDRALEEIEKRRGTQFDPELTDRFVELVMRLRKEHANVDEFLAVAGRNSPFLQARRKLKAMLAEERNREAVPALPGNTTRH